VSLDRTQGRAASACAAACLLATLLAGCHSVPIARVAPAPNRPQSALASAGRAALFPATVALDVPSELSSIDPASSRSVGSTEPSGALSEPAMAESAPLPTPTIPPTPLLDAAVERARTAADLKDGAVVRAFEPTAEIVLPPPAAGPVAASGVTSAPEASPPPAAAEPPKPEEAWHDGVRKLVGLARANGEHQGGAPGGTWDLRAKVLAWLAEPDLNPDLGPHDADGVRSVLKALEEAAGSASTPARGGDLRAAVHVLEDKAPLELVDLRVCSRVDDFGVFETFDPPVRKAGDQLVIYCEVDGLRNDATASGYRTRVAYEVEIVSEGGGAPVHSQPLGIAEETCRRRRRDYYIAHKLVLPRTIKPGEYRLRLTGRDLVADRTATRDVAFAVARD